MKTDPGPSENINSEDDSLLNQIQRRVLWLSTYMVDYANNVRQNPGKVKVGGHQASSSSVVTIMTYLFFEYMKAGDRLSVKPHASPVFHAIQYLLGNLDQKYLKLLRAFHGLQAYPSRTKDPDPVDFSTGSVGLGAVAPNFASMSEAYIRSHLDFDRTPSKYISLLGDAELDEGVVWEAIADPALEQLSNVLWVVDLNRQSLDRIIPGIRINAWRGMFDANGWHVIEAKYGKKLETAFQEPNGHLLKQTIDEMSNQTYQRLLRVSPEILRDWLPKTSKFPVDVKRLIDQWDNEELKDLFGNLGGHDFETLRESFEKVDLTKAPHVLFAYTLKGWSLPIVGDPQNHSASLNPDQMQQLRIQLGIPEQDDSFKFPTSSKEGQLCNQIQKRLYTKDDLDKPHTEFGIPNGFDRGYRGEISTQQIFGQVLTEISRTEPKLSERLVSISPDVASSTNLGGWINKAGVWSTTEPEPMPDQDGPRALQWSESAKGQHIELGISENNLFMALGQLGLSFETNGEILFPIGTLYDPFVRRGLDAFMYSVYSGGRFIVVATPSGITLGPEGGSHQSFMTPSIGLSLPNLSYYEPCFGQELEWIILSALEKIKQREESTFLRLTTKPVDQTLFQLPENPNLIEQLRQQVLQGGYRMIDRTLEYGYSPGTNVVNIIATGSLVPEAVMASKQLLDEEIMANVINVTGPGPLYRKFQQSIHSQLQGDPHTPILTDIIPTNERTAPLVTVIDGHPHTLAWLGGALGTTTYPLGITQYGQSGTPEELYKEYLVDSDSIMAACFSALGY